MKTKCTKCNVNKDASEFYNCSKKKNGLASWCKKCSSKQQHADRDKVNARRTLKRKTRDVTQKTADSKYKLKHRLKYEYGITLTEYDQLVEKQDGVCAICGARESQSNQYGARRLSVDHDHKTGEIRGLLCNKCNLGISYFDDDPKMLAEAIRYLL